MIYSLYFGISSWKINNHNNTSNNNNDENNSKIKYYSNIYNKNKKIYNSKNK